MKIWQPLLRFSRVFYLAGIFPAKLPNNRTTGLTDDVMVDPGKSSEPNRPQRNSKPAHGRMSALPSHI